jgi:hypothetical protein
VRATQHYWNSYNERGQAVQVPRLTLIKGRIDRMPTAKSAQAKKPLFRVSRRGPSGGGSFQDYGYD